MGPPIATELRLVLILATVCLLPGGALLALSGTWRRWQGLQRLIVAMGLSLAFYPVLFYGVRFLLPSASLHKGALTLMLLLLGTTVITTWWLARNDRMPSSKDQQPAGDDRARHSPWLSLAAIAVIGLTIVTRLWFAHAYPFPAWSDSLHHTLLTELTATHGRLPTTLQPYFPNSLAMYHLGLYALSGTVQVLAGASAHTALLWTAQFLNGLCGVGIFLVLDRYVGRTAAITGAAVAGLISVHPALWANWGRFTQLSAQVLLPIAWVLALEAMTTRGPSAGDRRDSRWWDVFFAGMASAAVFLFHFRVAVFYALLLIATLMVWLWPTIIASLGATRVAADAPVQRRFRPFLSGGLSLKWIMVVALVGLALALPALWGATDAYLGKRLAPQETLTAAQQAIAVENYYRFPLSTVPNLAAPIWLLAIGAVGGLLGLFGKNRLAAVVLLWLALLLPLGNTYRLGIPALNVTNMGAILIMFYLPMALLIGIGVDEAMGLFTKQQRARIELAFIILLLAAVLPASYERATTVETHRHFMTAADRDALEWIVANTPETAVFAINVYFWLPTLAHGTDAGYWIPYMAARGIVTSSMLTDGLPADYESWVMERARAAQELENDLAALDRLRSLGVEYIYIGARGDFSGSGLQPDFLEQSDKIEVLYQKDGVSVLRIQP